MGISQLIIDNPIVVILLAIVTGTTLVLIVDSITELLKHLIDKIFHKKN